MGFPVVRGYHAGQNHPGLSGQINRPQVAIGELSPPDRQDYIAADSDEAGAGLGFSPEQR
jgi:hypothetical protein